MTIYMNDNGYLVCPEHAGSYLKGAIKHKPEAVVHWTPLGSWERLDPYSMQWLQKEIGRVQLCEDCHREEIHDR